MTITEFVIGLLIILALPIAIRIIVDILDVLGRIVLYLIAFGIVFYVGYYIFQMLK